MNPIRIWLPIMRNSQIQKRKNTLRIIKKQLQAVNNTRSHQTLTPRSKVVESTKPDKNYFDNLCDENRLYTEVAIPRRLSNTKKCITPRNGRLNGMIKYQVVVFWSVLYMEKIQV
jgi:hypothetical protein